MSEWHWPGTSIFVPYIHYLKLTKKKHNLKKQGYVLLNIKECVQDCFKVNYMFNGVG